MLDEPHVLYIWIHAALLLLENCCLWNKVVAGRNDFDVCFSRNLNFLFASIPNIQFHAHLVSTHGHFHWSIGDPYSLVSPLNIGTLNYFRFLHPIIYGEYPKSVQNIVKERLPKFTADEVSIVKGSIDYVGVNQYTAYYVRDQQPNATTSLSYSSDWHAEFVCKFA